MCIRDSSTSRRRKTCGACQDNTSVPHSTMPQAHTTSTPVSYTHLSFQKHCLRCALSCASEVGVGIFALVPKQFFFVIPSYCELYCRKANRYEDIVFSERFVPLKCLSNSSIIVKDLLSLRYYTCRPLTRGSNSSIFWTMRCCSFNGGKGMKTSFIFATANPGCAVAVAY